MLAKAFLLIQSSFISENLPPDDFEEFELIDLIACCK